jgi:hypothetical protein
MPTRAAAEVLRDGVGVPGARAILGIGEDVWGVDQVDADELRSLLDLSALGPEHGQASVVEGQCSPPAILRRAFNELALFVPNDVVSDGHHARIPADVSIRPECAGLTSASSSNRSQECRRQPRPTVTLLHRSRRLILVELHHPLTLQNSQNRVVELVVIHWKEHCDYSCGSSDCTIAAGCAYGINLSEAQRATFLMHFSDRMLHLCL